METGNWIALGGVAVALASNGVTLYLGNKRLDFDRGAAERRFTHERALEDRRIAGEILDEAVLELRKIQSLLEQVMTLLKRRPAEFHLKPIGIELYDELSKIGFALDQRADRLRFRFEGHDLISSFEVLMDQGAFVYKLMADIRREDIENADTEEIKEEIRAFAEEKRGEIDESIEIFDDEVKVFRRHAFEVVGIKGV